MHHSENPRDRMSEGMEKLFASQREKLGDAEKRLLEQQAKEMGLGATGEYPEGKITASDEGEIRIAVGIHEGKVVINFGKPVAWIGFDAKQARALAELIRQQSYKLGKE